MFSGIIEERAVIDSVSQSGGGARVVVRSGLDHSETQLGDSIAVNGVCLTVVEKNDALLSFDAVNETIKRTNLKSVRSGSFVNLERSLRVGERVHGHFVFGHVDGVVKLLSSIQDGSSIRLSFDLPMEFRPYIVTKGSVSISGVSLTVGEVSGGSFSVYIIPHTAAETTLGALTIGEEANLEVDMLARYVLGARTERGEK